MRGLQFAPAGRTSGRISWRAAISVTEPRSKDTPVTRSDLSYPNTEHQRANVGAGRDCADGNGEVLTFHKEPGLHSEGSTIVRTTLPLRAISSSAVRRATAASSPWRTLKR